MAAAPRSLLAFWVGGAGSSSTQQAGIVGMLAPWLGGVARPASVQAGVTGMLAPWLGGASLPPAAATQAGTRSMLAFWLGGACALAGVVPPEPEPSPAPGGGRRPYRVYPSPDLADRYRRRLIDEDELILMLFSQFVVSLKP